MSIATAFKRLHYPTDVIAQYVRYIWLTRSAYAI